MPEFPQIFMEPVGSLLGNGVYCSMASTPSPALERVARENGLFYQPSFCDFTIGGTYVVNVPMHSMEPGYDARTALKQELSKVREGGSYLYVCHPGYLDHYLLENSSLTLPRTDEADMLCDPGIRRWLQEQAFELVTYDSLTGK